MPGVCRRPKRRACPAARGDIGEVAKRSNATDCKSVGPVSSEVRILPSPPTFRRCASRFGGTSRRKVGAARWQRGNSKEAAASSRSNGTSKQRTAGVLAAATSSWSAGLRAAAVSSARQANREGGSNSVVESQPSKLLVAGSIPVSRSKISRGASPRRTPPTPSLARPGGRAPAPAGGFASLAPFVRARVGTGEQCGADLSAGVASEVSADLSAGAASEASG